MANASANLLLSQIPKRHLLSHEQVRHLGRLKWGGRKDRLLLPALLSMGLLGSMRSRGMQLARWRNKCQTGSAEVSNQPHRQLRVTALDAVALAGAALAAHRGAAVAARQRALAAAVAWQANAGRGAGQGAGALQCKGVGAACRELARPILQKQALQACMHTCPHSSIMTSQPPNRLAWWEQLQRHS